MPVGNTYPAKPILDGEELFLIFTGTDTFNNTLEDITDFILEQVEPEIYMQDTAPSPMVESTLWIDTTTLSTFATYNDGDSVQYVQIDNGNYISDSITFPNSPTIGQQYTAAGKTWEWDGVKWVNVTPDNYIHYVPFESLEVAKALTGFVDNGSITVSYDHTNRQITLTGDLRYQWRGHIRELTSPWVSPIHPNTEATYFLYSSDGTNFAWSTTPWDFDMVMVALVRYRTLAVDTFALREVHGLMDKDSHEQLHSQQGTYRVSGGLPIAGTYTLNTASDAATTPGFDAAIVKDEDLQTTVSAWAEGSYTQFHVGAGSTSVFTLGASFPFRSAGSFLLVNNVTTGAMSPGINNRYYNVYQLLIPATADANSQAYRTVFIQPQATHTSLAAAQAEDPRGLSLGDLGGTIPEYVVFSRLTYLTANGDANTGKCRLMSITYVLGNRAGQVTVGGFTPSSHAALTDKEWLNSGHTGTASKLAGFGMSGEAAFYDLSIPFFDATIGTGGDYSDVAAAQTAGKYRLKAVGDITLNANTTISNNIYLDLNGYTMNCLTYSFFIDVTKTFFIFGNNGTITFAYSSAGSLFTVSTSKQLVITDITITNNSTISAAIFGGRGTVRNFITNCSNYQYCMFGSNTTNWEGILENGNIVGGGASSRHAIYNNVVSSDSGENITFSGVFQSSSTIAQSLNGSYYNITYTGSNVAYITLAKLDGLTDSNNRIYIDNYASVKNAIVSNSSFGYVLTFRRYSKFSNCYIHNNATLLNNTVNTDSDLIYDLCEFNGTLTVTGHRNKLSICKITGISSISSDYNVFIGCTFTGAVTLNSGAEYNIFVNCIFAGGLTDNSGNTTNIIKDNI